MTTGSRRELALACLLTLLGAAVVLIAVGRRWVEPSSAPSQAPATGEQVIPVARALALVALAGVVAVLAARGWLRLAVGVALVLSGAAIAVSAAREIDGAGTPAWPVLAAAGGLLVLAAGLLTAVRARSWPALGARYDAPETRHPIAAGDAWAALDRGEDPTAPDEK